MTEDYDSGGTWIDVHDQKCVSNYNLRALEEQR